MKLGNQRVDVVRVTEDLAGPRDANGQPAKIRTLTTVRGCRVRPLPAKEDTSNNGDRVTDPHRITAPPVPAILAIAPGDEIEHDGKVFQVTGLPRVFNDFSRPYKVTIEIERNIG